MRERGNCCVLPSHRKVAADLASGDRTQQGRGSVVLGGVTSTRGDGNTDAQGKGSQSDSNSKGVVMSLRAAPRNDEEVAHQW
jgi:hypothetical protein